MLCCKMSTTSRKQQRKLKFSTQDQGNKQVSLLNKNTSIGAMFDN